MTDYAKQLITKVSLNQVVFCYIDWFYNQFVLTYICIYTGTCRVSAHMSIRALIQVLHREVIHEETVDMNLTEYRVQMR